MPKAPSTPAANSQRSGRRDYSIVRSLGEGSFGTVFLVTHKTTGEHLVMKEVQLRGLSRSQLLRAREEVFVLRRLEHPNIIAYRDSFLEE